MISVLLSTATLADTWAPFPPIKNDTYEFGKVRILVTQDARKDRHFPKYSITIYEENKFVKKIEGFGAQKILASERNECFIGISNIGFTQHAYVIFTKKGKLLFSRKHSLNSPIPYCNYSITIHREWVDLENPEAEFTIENNILTEITILSCAGERIDLINTIKPKVWVTLEDKEVN